jgi:hypothetical protein
MKNMHDKEHISVKITRSLKMALWWNKKLSRLRAKTRRLFKIVKRTGQWDTYKETPTCYNKEIRKVKGSSWRRYSQISDVPGNARLTYIMAKQATNKVSTIKLPDCQYTQTGDTERVVQSSLS